jgi:hypothetical protein
METGMLAVSNFDYTHGNLCDPRGMKMETGMPAVHPGCIPAGNRLRSQRYGRETVAWRVLLISHRWKSQIPEV